MIPTILAGYGRFGRVYARRLEESLDLDLVGVVDIDSAPATCAGLPTFGDLASALEKTRARLVVVATPPEFHAELAVEALEAGADVVLAKPGALCVDDAARVAKTAWTTGRLVFVDYTPTEALGYRTLRSSPFQDGIITVRITRRGVARYQSCGALWDLAPHDVALAIGLDPADKVARVSASAWHYPDFEEPVGAYLHLTHASGRTTRIEVDWMSATTERRVEVVEFERMHVWDEATDAYAWTRRGYRADDRGDVVGLWDLELSPTRIRAAGDNVSRALARIVASIETGEDDTARYLEVTRILEAAELSLYAGSAVEFDSRRVLPEGVEATTT